MRVVAFTKYDREAASTRQRFLQYGPALAAAGIELTYRPLLDDAYVRSLATGERWSRARLLKSYLERLTRAFRRPDADILWIYGELFPYLPLMFDRLVLRSGTPVVYDCDDAFFVAYNHHPRPLVRRFLSGKIEKLIAAADAVTCGNEFLRDYAERFCEDCIVLPTVVDTDIYRPAPHDNAGAPTIGWIGSPSTWENVRPLLPVLERVCAEHGARFRVIGAGKDAQADLFSAMELVEWSEEQEVTEVQGFDIGIAPLIDAQFQRGKSGYKLIQYMACAVPAIASPVGANRTIIDSASGLFADTSDQWKDALDRLLGDPGLRQRLGSAARARAVEHYSLQAHAPRLIALFQEVHERRQHGPARARR